MTLTPIPTVNELDSYQIIAKMALSNPHWAKLDRDWEKI